jgi:histone-lysine N-methyltransferase SETMAR
MGSENAHGCAQNAENVFGFDFLERYHKDGDEFLNHIVQVIGDKTWVSFVNVETKEQSKKWVHTHSPNKPTKFKQTLSACQKADGNCFPQQERSADGGIRAKTDHNDARSVPRKRNEMLPWAILSKRMGMLTSGVVLLHDNAYPHSAARTRALLVHFSWELFDHPPYSPDLAPSEYHLFTRTYLKI